MGNKLTMILWMKSINYSPLQKKKHSLAVFLLILISTSLALLEITNHSGKLEVLFLELNSDTKFFRV